MPAHEKSLPDHALRRQHRRLARDAVRLAAIDGDRPREPGRVATDHAGGQEVALERAAKVEQLAEAGVLQVDLAEAVELLLQATRTLAQDDVLSPCAQQLRDATPALRDHAPE